MSLRKSIDHYLADIYALGIMLYEMLAGETPFHGEGIPYYAYAHAHAEPMRPSEVNLGIKLPEAVELLVIRCLAKKPTDRYRGVEDLANHRSILAGESRSSRRPLFIGHAVTTPEEAPPAPPRRFLSPPVKPTKEPDDRRAGSERAGAGAACRHGGAGCAGPPVAAGACAPGGKFTGSTILGLGLAPQRRRSVHRSRRSNPRSRIETGRG